MATLTTQTTTGDSKNHYSIIHLQSHALYQLSKFQTQQERSVSKNSWQRWYIIGKTLFVMFQRHFSSSG